MSRKTLSLLIWVTIVLSMIMGGTWGMYLAYGEFRLDVIVPIIVGTGIGVASTIFLSKRHKRKHGNVPEVDERTIKIMTKYIVVAFYVLLMILGIGLISLYAAGVHTVETGWLIVALMAVYIVLGLGAMVVKRV